MTGLFVPEIKGEAILEQLGDRVQRTAAPLLLHVTPDILIKVAVANNLSDKYLSERDLSVDVRCPAVGALCAREANP